MTDESSTEPRIVLATAPNADEARKLARTMVEARLAACVNLVDKATSVFRWEGEVREEAETLMLVKTTTARLGELLDLVEREHSYDVPEFVVLDPEAIEQGYREWLLAECAPGTEDGPSEGESSEAR